MLKCMFCVGVVGPVLDIFISCRRAPLKVFVWINFLLVTKGITKHDIMRKSFSKSRMISNGFLMQMSEHISSKYFFLRKSCCEVWIVL